MLFADYFPAELDSRAERSGRRFLAELDSRAGFGSRPGGSGQRFPAESDLRAENSGHRFPAESGSRAEFDSRAGHSGRRLPAESDSRAEFGSRERLGYFRGCERCWPTIIACVATIMGAPQVGLILDCVYEVVLCVYGRHWLFPDCQKSRGNAAATAVILTFPAKV